MADPSDVLTDAEPFMAQCGPCDYGMVEMGCACPKGDFRPVMSRLVHELDAARQTIARAVAARELLQADLTEQAVTIAAQHNELTALRLVKKAARAWLASISITETPEEADLALALGGFDWSAPPEVDRDKLREMAGALNRMQAKHPHGNYVGYGDGILEALGEPTGYMGKPITFAEPPAEP